jgi:hypothetical protein
VRLIGPYDPKAENDEPRFWCIPAGFNLPAAERYDTNAPDGSGGYLQVLWIPSIGRGAVRTNAGAEWGDAASPEELLRDYLAGELRN